ncbi:unnamed protein product [Amoebophrya sp. A25]|nr:unnamed protein product [Amoebophrya sp. A25]|eukprot:GSA25T00005235001.1
MKTSNNSGGLSPLRVGKNAANAMYNDHEEDHDFHEDDTDSDVCVVTEHVPRELRTGASPAAGGNSKYTVYSPINISKATGGGSGGPGVIEHDLVSPSSMLNGLRAGLNVNKIIWVHPPAPVPQDSFTLLRILRLPNARVHSFCGFSRILYEVPIFLAGVAFNPLCVIWALVFVYCVFDLDIGGTPAPTPSATNGWGASRYGHAVARAVWGSGQSHGPKEVIADNAPRELIKDGFLVRGQFYRWYIATVLSTLAMTELLKRMIQSPRPDYNYYANAGLKRSSTGESIFPTFWFVLIIGNQCKNVGCSRIQERRFILTVRCPGHTCLNQSEYVPIYTFFYTLTEFLLWRRHFGLPNRHKSFYSFPSGDTAQASNLAFFLLLYGDYAWGVLVLLPMVAIARVYYVCHWIEDTMCGAVVGAVMQLILFLWLQSLAPSDIAQPIPSSSPSTAPNAPVPLPPKSPLAKVGHP